MSTVTHVQSPTIRAFIALPSSERQRAHVAATIAKWRNAAPATVRDVHFANPEQAHLTLVFLGETEVADLPSLTDILHGVAARHEPFVWELGPLRGMPHASRARVAWLEVGRGRDEIVELQADLAETLQQAGLHQPERRRFRPHVTLARPRRKPAPLAELPAADGAEATASIVNLFGSRLGPQGARHEVLATAQLGRRD